MDMNTALKRARTLVVKVGSSLVTNEGRGVDAEAIARWAAQIAQLAALDKHVILVSSGAIAEGMKRLGWHRRPRAIHELQAAAAVGQMGLVQCYESCFRAYGLHTAQVLLTHADMADRHRYLNARSTLRTLLAMRAIPVVNENDTVVTDEIKLGDNDTLAALVTNLVEAELVREAIAGDPRLERMAGGAGSALAKGGMLTKVLAAKRAARSGAHTIIASGREADVLPRILAGEAIGTRLLAETVPLAARKQWLADHLNVSGRLTLDAGATKALVRDGKSLLPIGVRAIAGEFQRGAVVACLDPEGREVARGLVNYPADEARRIMGRPSRDIEGILGYVDEPELINRDNLVLL